MVLKFLAPEPSRNILSCLNLQKLLKRFLFLKWFLCLVLLPTVSVWAQIKDEEDSSSNNPVQENPAISESLEGLQDLSTLQQEDVDPEKLKEIQIIRLSPGIVKKPEGQLRFQVSAFSPILAVKVNGYAQMIRPGLDFMEYEVPYQLLPGDNTFEIFVQTRDAEIRQPILLTYNPPQIIQPREPLPVDLVLILGQVQSDNMLLVPESSTKRSASKNELLLSLSYHFPLGKIQKLFFKGLLKIDRQQDRSLASQEILFRQFGLDYQDRDLWGFSFTSGLGQNVISSKSDAASSGSEGFVKTSESLFLFGSAENKFGKSTSLHTKLQLEMQNKVTTDSEDGTLNHFYLDGKTTLFGIRLNGGLQNSSSGFKETVKNYQTSVFKMGIQYPWESWIFGFQFRTSDQKYKELDPASQIIPHHKQDLISLQSKYSFTKTMIGDLTLNQTKKASNDASKAYQESQLALQLIMVY